jgi:hypothetical protein
MKRFFTLLLMLAVAAFAVSANAAPMADLASLAKYMPADSGIYLAARTDADYLATIDGLLQRLGSAVDQPTPSIAESLNQQLAQAGLSLESDIFPSLGGFIALAVEVNPLTNRDDDAPVVLALSVADQARVLELIQLADTNAQNLTYTEANGYTLIADTSNANVAILLAADVLLITNNRTDIEALYSQSTSLATEQAFIDTLALLPESDYNIAAYVNTPAIVGPLLPMLQTGLGDLPAEQRDQVAALFAALPPQVLGATILNGDALTIDAATRYRDFSSFEAFGYTFNTEAAPVDFSMAARLPANTMAATFSTDFGNYAQSLINVYSVFGALAVQAEVNRTEQRGFDVPPLAAYSIDAPDFRYALNALVRGLIGVDLYQTILPNANGQMASYINLRTDPTTTITADAGVAWQVTNADAAAEIYNGFVGMATDLNGNFTNENQTLTLRGVISGLLPPQEAARIDTPSLDVQIGYNSDVFVVGTRNAATQLLTPSGDTLNNHAAFQRAQTTALADSEAFYYLDAAAIAQFADDLAAQLGEDGDARDLRNLSNLLGVFSSATLSVRIDSDYTIRTRAVITLTEGL